MSEPATITLRQLLGSCPQLSRAQIYNILRGPGGLSEEQLADEGLKLTSESICVVALMAADLILLDKTLTFDEVLRVLNFFAEDMKRDAGTGGGILQLSDFRYVSFSRTKRVLDVKVGEEAQMPEQWVRSTCFNLTSLVAVRFANLGKAPGARR